MSAFIWMTVLTALRILARNRLRAGLTRAFDETGAEAQVTGIGSLFNVHFTREPIADGRGPRSASSELAHLFFLEMLNQGFVMAPRGMGALSTPTTEDDVDDFVDAARRALQALGSG